MCTVGHIIVASAKTNNQVIAGLAIAGFGGANCQVYHSISVLLEGMTDPG